LEDIKLQSLDDEGSKFEYYFLIILAKWKKRNTSEGILNFQKKISIRKACSIWFSTRKTVFPCSEKLPLFSSGPP